LDLTGTKVTDAGMKNLGELTQLRILRIYGTKVSDAGVKTLRNRLPNCEIEWNPPTDGERQSRATPD
jgi:hypothetical protein